jgi:hypothetical protein
LRHGGVWQHSHGACMAISMGHLFKVRYTTPPHNMLSIHERALAPSHRGLTINSSSRAHNIAQGITTFLACLGAAVFCRCHSARMQPNVKFVWPQTGHMTMQIVESPHNARTLTENMLYGARKQSLIVCVSARCILLCLYAHTLQY